MHTIDTHTALTHFHTRDPIMARLLEEALNADNPLQLPRAKQPKDYFPSLVTSIISQQISTKAAAAVSERFVTGIGGTISPEAILQHDFDTLKSFGLSGQKTKYIQHNAKMWHQLPIEDFAQMDDEAIITELTKLYGIGRWTAEMFLIFSMARADVFSYGDLGLMQGLYKAYNYKPHYVRKVQKTVESWAPHRTAASLALWYYKDNGPVIL